MRPLELQVRDFRSFFGEAPAVDFRDRRLIGIVGPIGSGKSTLLDAVAFALYGRTPRIGRATKSLIHQRADSAAVRMRFQVDGDVWEVRRMIRRAGASQTSLWRLAGDGEDPEPVEKIVQETDVNERVAQLLGFDFEAFGRSVLLAQGQFAEFLTARPAERDKVLKGVFGHERIDAMRDLARVRVRDGEHEIDKLGIRLEQAEQAMARLGERRIELTESEDRLALLEKHQPRVAELEATAAAAATRGQAARERLIELRHHAERMPDSMQTESLLDRANAARAERARLAAALEAAHTRLTAAEGELRSDDHRARQARLTEAETLIGERRVRARELELAEQQAAAAAQRHADYAAAAAAAAARVEAAANRSGAAEAQARAAREAAAIASAALDEATHADMAAGLRSRLVVGEPCPVCAQTVTALDAGDLPGDLVAARQTADAAAAELAAAERELAAAAGESDAAAAAQAELEARAEDGRAELGELEAAVERARRALGDVDRELARLVGEGNPQARQAELAAAIEAAQAAVEAARAAADDARRQHDAAIKTEQEADRLLGDLRTQLGALAALLDADATLPDDDPAALAAALGELRTGWATETARLRDEAEAAERAREDAEREQGSLLRELDVGETLDQAVAAATAAVTLLAKGIADDEATVAAAEGLIAARRAEAEQVERFRRIAGDLTDAKFIRYLLDEERAALAELGSDHFQRLSSGRYRFTADGKFEVVDLTTADAVRRADSLSGGETFLASLGLALGLAEMVSRTGGRLDAFFLDEGFGSLDPEHLDLAMEGIERLVADGSDRLVVAVSHVPEMRQRIEDLIVLDRDPTTGDSIVIAGASG